MVLFVILKYCFDMYSLYVDVVICRLVFVLVRVVVCVIMFLYVYSVVVMLVSMCWIVWKCVIGLLNCWCVCVWLSDV